MTWSAANPGSPRPYWRETLVDPAIFREWTSNIGSRSAYARAAHLLCEFFLKMKVVGLADGGTCRLPLT